MHNKLFPSQKPEEKIYLIVREHWFKLFEKFFIIGVLFLLPFIIFPIINNAGSLLPFDGFMKILFIFRDFYWIALLVASFVILVIYYLNLHIVSEERVVDIDQVGLLKHVVSELNLESIEDVSSSTTGFFGNFLDYGTVFIQTAGASERFQFENVPNPAHIANIILTLFEAHDKKQDQRNEIKTQG